MANYVSPKDFLNAFVAAIRTHTVEPLASAVVRKGPQRSIHLGDDETCVVFARIGALDGGEVSAGSGNYWWQEWSVIVVLATPDDETEAQYDMLLDLLEEFGSFLHANRNIGNAKVLRMAEAECVQMELLEPQQKFNAVEVSVHYKTMKGG